MRDVGILRRAAEILREPIYVVGDDMADHFNQLVMAPSERHKMGIAMLARDGELEDAVNDGAPAINGARLIFVSERVLGFGTHGASNITQRWSDALLHLFRCDMDAADASSLESPSPLMQQWRGARADMAATLRLPCRSTAAACDIAVPPTCEYERLYAAYVFTDDPVFVVVGAERTVRALRTWRRLTADSGLIMASPQKRHLGSHAMWLGVKKRARDPSATHTSWPV